MDQQQVIPFLFKNKIQVRVFPYEGRELFPAKDIAEALGYTQSQNMLSKVDEDDIFKSSIFNDFKSLGLSSASKLINESGVYAAIFGSKKKESRKFKKWVTSVVLPAIRKTGGYHIASNPDVSVVDMAKAIVLQQQTNGSLLMQLDEMTSKRADAVERQRKAEAENLELRAMLHNSSVHNTAQLSRAYRLKASGYLTPTEIAHRANPFLEDLGLGKISAQKVNKFLETRGYQSAVAVEDRMQVYNSYGNTPVNVSFKWYVGNDVSAHKYRLIPTAVTGAHNHLTISYKWSPSIVTEIIDYYVDAYQPEKEEV
jgi:prophage antirepressor-like protein